MGTDRWEGLLTPPATGNWSFVIEAWHDRYGTWHHNAEVKVEAGIDVELMLAEGAALLAEASEDASRPSGDRAERCGWPSSSSRHVPDTRGTPRRRLRRRRRRRRRTPAHPRTCDGLRALPAAGGANACRARRLVRILPALRRRRAQPRHGGMDLRQLPHRRAAPRRRRRHGLRHHLHAADPPDRRPAPQGAEQHPDRRAARSRLAVGHRVPGGRPRRHPPGPGHLRGLRRLRGAGRRAGTRGGPGPGPAGRAGPPVGRKATRNGSPRASTALLPTPRIRRRNTRTFSR